MATKKVASTSKKKPTSPARKTATSSVTKVSTVTAPTNVTTTNRFSTKLKDLSFWRSLSAELLAAFLLTAAVIAGQGQPIIVLFALVGIVLVFGAVSGAHTNPAITIAAWITRRITSLRALGYILAQFLGAALAFIVFSAFVSGADNSGQAALYGQAVEVFKANALPANKEWYVFFAEVLGAGILGLAYASALKIGQSRLVSAFTAGLGIFVALMAAFTATSYVTATAVLNPAVAVGVQALSFDNWSLVVYLLGPILGAVIGFFIYDFVVGGRRAR